MSFVKNLKFFCRRSWSNWFSNCSSALNIFLYISWWSSLSQNKTKLLYNWKRGNQIVIKSFKTCTISQWRRKLKISLYLHISTLGLVSNYINHVLTSNWYKAKTIKKTSLSYRCPELRRHIKTHTHTYKYTEMRSAKCAVLQ